VTLLTLSGVTGRKLRRVEMSFAPGVVHGLVGGAEEEGAELVAICAGIERPKRGTVHLGAKRPFQSPETRRRIGALLQIEEPLEGSIVEISVARSLDIHGSVVGARAALASFGAESLLPRPIPSLSPYEARTVALALALALEAPLLLVLHEPFAAGLPRADVQARLASRAAAGAVVLCVMASAREAADVGAELISLRSRGSLARNPPSADGSGASS
jgi:ABC-type sulfate/molybdate transport systems ATPase subunit